MKAEFSQRRIHENVHEKWKWKILILVYLCFIYGNSLTPAAISSKESGYFLAKIQDFLAGAGMDAWWLTEHLVRKAAHFTEYAGLGFLLEMNTGAGIAPVFCFKRKCDGSTFYAFCR